VRYASGEIENNLVYKNNSAGIRFGWENTGDPHITHIRNNTVVSNGKGGIVYDDLAGAFDDSPGGEPPAPLTVRNNIAAHNEKGGIRACFDNTEGSEERDYNLVYSNNGTGESDCGWPDTLSMRCLNKNFGGCGGKWNEPGVTPRIVTDGPNNMVSDPEFVNTASDDYRLDATSIAIGAGDDGNDLGAYGGDYPVDDSEIPGP
jgi:hypothetical protein